VSCLLVGFCFCWEIKKDNSQITEAGICLFFICSTTDDDKKMKVFFVWRKTMNKMNIAIDGPAGAGKSTVAKRLAKELGYLYIDTGAMYRALTLQAMRLGIDLHDEVKLNQYLQEHPIQLILEKGEQKVYIDGQDVTEAIRTNEVSQNVSLVAAHPLIRNTMVTLQRNLAKDGNVVMDGRDIGTNVLPDAKLKIFLTASIEERAKRRYKELKDKGFQGTLNELIEDIALRDKKDQERAVAPLRQAEDAILIETSHLSIEEVVEEIRKHLWERIGDDKR